MSKLPKTIEGCAREWDYTRWVILEPKWQITKLLLEPGWIWTSPASVKRQCLFLHEYVIHNTTGDEARRLVRSCQALHLLRALSRSWSTSPRVFGSVSLTILDTTITKLSKVKYKGTLEEAAYSETDVVVEWNRLNQIEQMAVYNVVSSVIRQLAGRISGVFSCDPKECMEVALRRYPEIKCFVEICTGEKIVL